ncbi:N-ethylmaleimide reductase [Lentzea xinjiangensis]|uniref:N-ethylmaleimide reductase n=1 Tax=Lentzea xinjiangensis TaxID=402600 RepID=A0A1H9RRJ2_9PSEU|nr:alkene reductase [Lentzea xinjiangensis]SER75148.1 N-ethylmaleimide reductase [Lentzea xinjiangensis]
MLLTSYRLGNLTLPNRLVMAPMTRSRAVDGKPTAATATYYAQRATAGLIVTEGVHPNAVGQAGPSMPGIHTDEQVEAWRVVTDAVHVNGGRIFAQLMHGGRIGHAEVAGHQPVGPSAIAAGTDVFTPTGLKPAPVPRALTTQEVAEQVEAFADAARRAVDAGFDGVELHGANGYLIQQFLSTSANRRTDGYGGSITGRIRFAVEAVGAVADAIGPERVGIRLSPGGEIQGIVEENVPALYSELLKALPDIAYVHLLATVDDERLMALRKAWPTTFILNPGGQIGPHESTREQGERWLANGADLISYGRAYLGNPDLVERFRLGLPLVSTDRETWFQSPRGYIDYPSYQH